MFTRHAALAALLALVSASAMATPCEEVIGKIDAKIKANGVKNFTLDAIPLAEVKDQKIVGTCGAGTMKIVYARTTPAKPADSVSASAAGTAGKPVVALQAQDKALQ
jgi:hypothetical protein